MVFSGVGAALSWSGIGGATGAGGGEVTGRLAASLRVSGVKGAGAGVFAWVCPDVAGPALLMRITPWLSV
jgi:hypothetical protein